MSLRTADAIVLRRYPYRETSVTVTCLTEPFGKLKGLVKGLRTHPSRHRSAMEPLTINRIVFYDTRSSQLHLISHCELIVPLSGLPRDLETMRLACRIVDVVDAIVPLEEPQPATYRLVRFALEALSDGRVDPGELRAYVFVRVLRLAGFQPQFDECASCGAHADTPAYWSTRQGGLLCAACLHEDPKAPPAPPELLDAIGRLAEADHPLTLDPGLSRRLHTCIHDFLAWRLERPLKTMASEASAPSAG